MIEASESDLLRPAGLSDGETKDNAPVNVDGILQSILGTGGERFGMGAAVLRSKRIIAQGAPGPVTPAPPLRCHPISADAAVELTCIK
jgi:hypothetical protein